eukprot:UN24352
MHKRLVQTSDTNLKPSSAVFSFFFGIFRKHDKLQFHKRTRFLFHFPRYGKNMTSYNFTKRKFNFSLFCFQANFSCRK